MLHHPKSTAHHRLLDPKRVQEPEPIVVFLPNRMQIDVVFLSDSKENALDFSPTPLTQYLLDPRRTLIAAFNLQIAERNR